MIPSTAKRSTRCVSSSVEPPSAIGRRLFRCAGGCPAGSEPCAARYSASRRRPGSPETIRQSRRREGCALHRRRELPSGEGHARLRHRFSPRRASPPPASQPSSTTSTMPRSRSACRRLASDWRRRSNPGREERRGRPGKPHRRAEGAHERRRRLSRPTGPGRPWGCVRRTRRSCARADRRTRRWRRKGRPERSADPVAGRGPGRESGRCR